MKKYIKSSTITNPTIVETDRGISYLWQDGKDFKVSIEDPRGRITNARKIHTIQDCDTEAEAIEVVKRYF